MITTREELKYYQECDKKALGIERKRPKLFGDRIWKFERLYRKTEFFYNNRNKSIPYKLLALYYTYKYKKASAARCCEIPINCIREGFVIWHGYNIIINDNARIGKNFGISSSCTIGHRHNQIPVLGDNVTMNIGSSILGGVHICDNVTIGAHSLVLKDIDTEFCTVGGNPAHTLRVHWGGGGYQEDSDIICACGFNKI